MLLKEVDTLNLIRKFAVFVVKENLFGKMKWKQFKEDKIRKVIIKDTFLNLKILTQSIDQVIFQRLLKAMCQLISLKLDYASLMCLHCSFWITILCVRRNWCLKLVCLIVLKQVLCNLGQQRKCQCTRLAQF